MQRLEVNKVEKHSIFGRIGVKVAFSPVCNYQCAYCGGSDNRKQASVPGAMEDYRANAITEGSITTPQLLNSLAYLQAAGFGNFKVTGGEPLLRRDWRTVVEVASEIGPKGIDITTNAELLAEDIEDHDGILPRGLSLVKVSLDTLDPEKFKELSGGKGNLDRVIRGVDATIAAGVPVRLNTVMLRDNFNPKWIQGMVKFCADHKVGAIQFLDLVHYPNLPKAPEKAGDWVKQFVDFSEFQQVFRQVFPEVVFTLAEEQYGVNFWTTKVMIGDQEVRVNFKDSTETMRNESCKECNTYCQEGRCLVRLGTDGNMTPCPDYQANLPNHFNVFEAIENGTFNNQMKPVAQVFAAATRMRTIETFKLRHGIPSPASWLRTSFNR